MSTHAGHLGGPQRGQRRLDPDARHLRLLRKVLHHHRGENQLWWSVFDDVHGTAADSGRLVSRHAVRVKINTQRATVGALVGVVSLLTACSATNDSPSGPQTTSAPTPTSTSTAPHTTDTGPNPSSDVTITGMATNANGEPYQSVALGFKKVNCQDCTMVSAVTDRDGRYLAHLPPADYLVVCMATPFTCSFLSSGTYQDSLNVSSDSTLDVTVDASDLHPLPPRQTSESPTTPPDSPVSQRALSGHVLTNEGKPVPHVTIQLLPPGRVGGTFFTNTAADGSYAIDGTSGVYTVVCVVSGNPDYACGPVDGDGTGPTVNLADPPQVIEFILCRSENYPRCLSK